MTFQGQKVTFGVTSRVTLRETPKFELLLIFWGFGGSRRSAASHFLDHHSWLLKLGPQSCIRKGIVLWVTNCVFVVCPSLHLIPWRCFQGPGRLNQGWRVSSCLPHRGVGLLIRWGFQHLVQNTEQVGSLAKSSIEASKSSIEPLKEALSNPKRFYRTPIWPPNKFYRTLVWSAANGGFKRWGL